MRPVAKLLQTWWHLKLCARNAVSSYAEPVSRTVSYLQQYSSCHPAADGYQGPKSRCILQASGPVRETLPALLAKRHGSERYIRTYGVLYIAYHCRMDRYFHIWKSLFVALPICTNIQSNIWRSIHRFVTCLLHNTETLQKHTH
jgi:hypothetical protein